MAFAKPGPRWSKVIAGRPLIRAQPSAAPLQTPSNSPSTARIGTSSSALTSAISVVPGLAKHTSIPAAAAVRNTASAPVIAPLLSFESALSGAVRIRAWCAAELILQRDPGAERSAYGAELLDGGIDPRCGAKRPARTGERVLSQDGEVRVTGTEEIERARGEPQPLQDPVARLQFDDRVPRHLSVHVLVVLVTSRVDAGGGNNAPADRQIAHYLPIRLQLQRVFRNARNAIAPPHGHRVADAVAIRVLGRRVRRARELEGRLEGSADEPVRDAPGDVAGMESQADLEAAAPGLSHICEEPGVQ